MSQLLWRIVERLSRLLEADERDAAVGDLVESGASSWRALGELLGLIARRQVALWVDWRPWIALIGIPVPLVFMLLSFSVVLSGYFKLYSWILGNYEYIEPAMLEDTGLTFQHGVAFLVRHGFLMVSWSWTGGYALGSLSRRATWFNVLVLFCLAAFSAVAAVGSVRSMDVSVLLGLSAAFVFLPLFWGVKTALRRGLLRLRWAVLLATTIGIATAHGVWAGLWWYGSVFQTVHLIVPIVLFWPAVYILVISVRQSSQRRQALS